MHDSNSNKILKTDLYKNVESALNNRILKNKSNTSLTYKDIFDAKVNNKKSQKKLTSKMYQKEKVYTGKG